MNSAAARAMQRLETRFLESAAAGDFRRGDAETADLVDRLEKLGGSQLPAAFNRGRWTLPWVGGWECKWLSQEDASFLGGPALTLVKALCAVHRARALERARGAPVVPVFWRVRRRRRAADAA